MAQVFGEAISRASDAPLRQGDVIEAVADDAPQWTRHLLVITADCDLANSKNAGRVTCVPLLQADEYLLSFLMPEHRRRTIDRLAAEFNDHLHQGGRGRISPERVVEWVLEAGTDEIIQELQLGESQSDGVRRACQGIEFASRAASSLPDATRDLISAQLMHVNPKPEDRLLASFRDALSSRFKQPPGDSLFISQIAPGYESGYFAYLRHIEQVWEPEVAVGGGRSEVSHRRIGALNDRFTHAVVQRFAMVFMPIGLPPDYEDSRNSYAEKVGRLVF